MTEHVEICAHGLSTDASDVLGTNVLSSRWNEEHASF